MQQITGSSCRVSLKEVVRILSKHTAGTSAHPEPCHEMMIIHPNHFTLMTQKIRRSPPKEKKTIEDSRFGIDEEGCVIPVTEEVYDYSKLNDAFIEYITPI